MRKGGGHQESEPQHVDDGPTVVGSLGLELRGEPDINERLRAGCVSEDRLMSTIDCGASECVISEQLAPEDTTRPFAGSQEGVR